MADSYDYWRAELEKPSENAMARDVGHTDICGFWRIQAAKTKADYPVAIWPEDGSTRKWIKIGHQKPAYLDEGSEDFMLSPGWMNSRAVTHEDYQTALESGLWPDRKPARADMFPKKEPEPVKEPEAAPAPQKLQNSVAGIGHNSMPMGEDFAERLKAESALLAELTATAVKDDETAEKIGELKNRVLAIKKEATETHKTIKAPILEEGRKIDQAFKPTIENCEAVAKKAGAAVVPYLAEKQRKLEEEARAEAARKQAEAEAKARRDAEMRGEDMEAAAAEVKEVKVKEVKAAVGKAAGRAVSMRTFTFAEITDYDALLTALKDRDEVKELVQSLANRAAKSGKDLPGMKIKQEQRAA